MGFGAAAARRVATKTITRGGSRASHSARPSASHTPHPSAAHAEHKALGSSVKPVKPITNVVKAGEGRASAAWAKTTGTAVVVAGGAYAHHVLSQDAEKVVEGAGDLAEGLGNHLQQLTEDARETGSHLADRVSSVASSEGVLSGLANASSSITTVVVVGLVAFVGLEVYRRYGQS